MVPLVSRRRRLGTLLHDALVLQGRTPQNDFQDGHVSAEKSVMKLLPQLLESLGAFIEPYRGTLFHGIITADSWERIGAGVL